MPTEDFIPSFLCQFSFQQLSSYVFLLLNNFSAFVLHFEKSLPRCEEDYKQLGPALYCHKDFLVLQSPNHDYRLTGKFKAYS